MTTTGINITLYRGEDKSIAVTTLEHTKPFPLDSAVIKWAMQRTLDDTTPVLYKDTANGITITDEAKGNFTIRINASDTIDIPVGTYHHIAKVIDSNGDHSMLFIGLITLQKGSKNI